MKDRLRLIGAVVLTTAILVFAYQNLDPQTIRFLMWDFSASVSLVTLSAFLGGLVTGAAGMALRRHKAKKELPSGKKEKKEKQAAKALPQPAAEKLPLPPPLPTPAAAPPPTPAPADGAVADDGGLSDADRKLLQEAGLDDGED